MQNFHEHKLWQDAFVTLIDVHDAVDEQRNGDGEEIVEKLLDSATTLTANIADGLSRLDKRTGKQICTDAVGMVAIVRTHLAVCWGRELVDDETFQKLDAKYADLGVALQNTRI